LTLLVAWQEGHPACKKWGDGGGGHWLVWMEWRPAGWSVSTSVNLPLHHKVQKLSSGTGSRGWSQKKGRKTVVVWFLKWVTISDSTDMPVLIMSLKLWPYSRMEM